jgi:2,3-bisphosphoglycerate-dependent phosphoglycerate mutase
LRLKNFSNKRIDGSRILGKNSSMPQDFLVVDYVRHAQSESNAGGKTTLSKDIPLTELGKLQAQARAQSITREPDLIIHSPYIRTSQMVGYLKGVYPQAPVQEWPIEEFTYLDPMRWPQRSTREQRLGAINEYWMRLDPWYKDGPRAESFVDMITRVYRSLSNLEARFKAGDRYIVSYGHGQFMGALRMIVECSHPEAEPREFIYFFREAQQREPIPNAGGFSLRYGAENAGDVPRWAVTGVIPPPAL